MKYKVGDRVRIKNLDWYNRHTNGTEIDCGGVPFTSDMKRFCSRVMTISFVHADCYAMVEDLENYYADEMIEGLVEEKNNDCEKCGITRNSTRCLFMDNCPHNKQKNIIEIPENYVLKDENGNVINATKIILEKKKKEYPKTYEECCEVLGYGDIETYCIFHTGADEKLFEALYRLKVCRDAYWKIAGDEMGLGKPWEPDWTNISDKYCIYFVSGNAWSKECQTRQCPFAFPTSEMRDAFKENFDPDIEICKELL